MMSRRQYGQDAWLCFLLLTLVGSGTCVRRYTTFIATSNKMGHPNIFLTMTCNPNLPEIRRSLLPGQSPQDRPDLWARVFKLNLKALMEAVIKGKICGEVVAYVTVIEFQKRRLPHAHCIFILDQASKNPLRNPASVDTVTSAEMPPEDDDELRELMLQHIVHNPCGSQNPATVRMGRPGGARKTFPSFFGPRRGSLKAKITYRTGSGVQKKVVKLQRDPCAGTLSRRLTTLGLLRITRM